MGSWMQEYLSAWNSNSVDRILDHYAEDAVVVGGMPEPARGKAAVRKNLEAFFRTFSEVNGDAEVLLASGEYVSALLHVTSKHTGPMDLGGGKSAPATNKKVKDTIAVFLQLDANGKIAREWDVGNQLATFQQLGIAPPTGTAQARPTDTARR